MEGSEFRQATEVVFAAAETLLVFTDKTLYLLTTNKKCECTHISCRERLYRCNSSQKSLQLPKPTFTLLHVMHTMR